MAAADPRPLEPIPLAAIEAARERIAGLALRTPLIRLDAPEAPAEIWLKLETLQPIGSFKLRGANNAMEAAGREALAGGVWTASAGNMAQGVAWSARKLGVPCTVIVPDTAPQTKIAAVERFGGTVVRVTVQEWLEIFRTRHREGMTGVFVHPYSDPLVMAGNGVIGLEILEDLPDDPRDRHVLEDAVPLSVRHQPERRGDPDEVARQAGRLGLDLLPGAVEQCERLAALLDDDAGEMRAADEVAVLGVGAPQAIRPLDDDRVNVALGHEPVEVLLHVISFSLEKEDVGEPGSPTPPLLPV